MEAHCRASVFDDGRAILDHLRHDSASDDSGVYDKSLILMSAAVFIG